MIFTVTLNPGIDKEYSVPQLVMDEVLRANSMRLDFGGKGFNVSRMLSSLGAKSIAVGLIGGHAGELLQNGLASLGIQTGFIRITGETRTNISIINQEQRHYVKVNESGPTISSQEISDLLKKIKELVQPGDWWVLAGSLPPGVPDDIYSQIINIIQTGKAHAVLDTSGQPLLLGCQSRPYLVKPNASEAAQLSGKPHDTIQQLTEIPAFIHQLGAENVVISAGKKGALLSTGSNQWFGAAPKIKEQNPIGAGDAMVAGLVWRLAMGEPLPSALKWGIACGAATASQAGTGMASRSLVETLLPKIELKEVTNAIRSISNKNI